MPQHLWRRFSTVRAREVCLTCQTETTGEWVPPVGLICPGDRDDHPARRAARGGQAAYAADRRAEGAGDGRCLILPQTSTTRGRSGRGGPSRGRAGVVAHTRRHRSLDFLFSQKASELPLEYSVLLAQPCFSIARCGMSGLVDTADK